jgi:hypothetical protein
VPRQLLVLCSTLVAFGVGLASPAWGEEPAPKPATGDIALTYSAPAECPDDEAFRQEVRARVTGDWEAPPGELARRITVSVVFRGDHYRAAIEFLNSQGDKVTRSVAGKSCPDVVTGMALVTALAIQSRVDEALEESEPESPPAAAPMPSVATPPPALSQAEPVSVAPPSRTHLRFGAAAVVATGVGPEPSFGPAFFFVFEWDGPRLGVAGELLLSGSVLAEGVRAQFRRLAVRAEGCPWSGSAGVLTFEPCAFFEVGSLRGDGTLDPPRVIRESGGASPWLAPGVLLRLVTSFGPMLVTLDGSARFPLVRQEFGVVAAGDPEPFPVYRVPWVAFGASLGLGIRL